MLVKIEYPPGLRRMGTEYQNKLAYYDANLWRWSKGESGPVGGWEQLGASTVPGKARAIHSWIDLSGISYVAIASEQALVVSDTSGTLTTITPSGWTNTDADQSTWTLDNAGQQLFGVNDEDGVVYSWLPGAGQATTLTNAPTGSFLLVTDERILMVFGAGGDPRSIKWSDVEGFTTWTPSTTNFTRDFPLQSSGELMCALKMQGGVLILTSEDVHLGRFLGRPSVYGFEQKGTDCGAISRGCAVEAEDMTYWMGVDSFYRWNGGVDELPCPIHDDVFLEGTGFNRAYASKVRAVHMPANNEIWWAYPKGAATENDTVAVYNYVEGHWTHHALVRLCGTARGAGFDYSLLLGSDGKIWQHEKGTARDGAGTIFARGGPKELGQGDSIFYGNYLISDEANQGDVQTYVHTRLDPNGAETTTGPFTSASQRAGCSFVGRQAALEHRLVSGAGTVGTFRVDVQGGGEG